MGRILGRTSLTVTFFCELKVLQKKSYKIQRPQGKVKSEGNSKLSGGPRSNDYKALRHVYYRPSTYAGKIERVETGWQIWRSKRLLA